MNDEKRKSARLQGRFSDEPKSSRKDKSKRKSDEGESNRKSLESRSIELTDSFELKFDDAAHFSFSQLEEENKPVEIKDSGEHILSLTDNGISRVIFVPDFLPKKEADQLMTLLRESTKWYDKNIIIHGQEVPQPRQVAWYGPFPYAYSGAVLDAAEMPPEILDIKERVEMYLEAQNIDATFNSVLLNLYRDGKDSVAWHSDDEMTMGVSPTIASVSLGEIRKFQMKIKPNAIESDKNLVSGEYFVHLTPGSLLIMDGCMQKDWKHQIPKEYHDRSARINLTFRTVYPLDKVPAEVPSKTPTQSLRTQKEAAKPIVDNSNFPPLEPVNTQNGSSSDMLKDSNTSSKLATNANTSEVTTSDQSYPDDGMLLDSSIESDTPAHLEDEPHPDPPQPDADVCRTSDVADCDYQFDAFEELNPDMNVASGGSSNDSAGTSDGNHSSKTYQLRPDADEFIPKCPLPKEPVSREDSLDPYATSDFYNYSVTRLAEMYDDMKIPPSRYDELFKIMYDKFAQNPNFLSDRDWYEVDTLAKLFDNTLSEINQTVVFDRISSMVKNAARIKFRNKNMSYRFPTTRTGYRNTYTRSRGSFKGSVSKDKNYRD